ncbi:MAG: histidine kinase dimerization/phospho-acceptor domain-containing protein [Thermodesulfovibrionales bacterium]
MQILALLSNRDEIVSEVKTALKKQIIYPVKTFDEFEELYSNFKVNLILIDTVSYRMSSLEEILNRLDNNTVILITPEKVNEFNMENMPLSVFCCVESQFLYEELPLMVEHALDKQKLKKMERLLEKSTEESFTYELQNNINSYYGREGEMNYPSGRSLQVLVNFAKVLTVSFDMKRLFNHFMESVMGISRVSKMSIMLKDKEGFYVKAQHGLDQYIAGNLRLGKDSALATWLSKTGRIRRKPISPADTASMNIKSEMELLDCTFSFPMIYKGRLIGIFNIHDKVIDEPFYREDLETIYVLCNYLAVAVKDIDLYHQILYQKEFTKNVLSSMPSGVIAIDKDEKITVFNQRSSEILNLSPSEILGKDLRKLPSPLGDILYETMVTGNSYKRYEAEILQERVPVGIASCRLLDENHVPIGAVIVFTDLSDSKRLEEEKRNTEKLQAVNELMAKLADEIRNPMTSINTYTQLMNEKFRDEELNNFYSTVVLQSIHKIDNLIDKLIIFSSKSEFNLNKEDVNSIIDESSDYILKNIPSSHKFLKQNIDKTVFINADKKMLLKAIYYLLLSAIERTPEGAFITLGATMQDGSPYIEISVNYSGKEFTDKEKEEFFRPILDMDKLGKELNVPISRKIIEGHGGSLSIKSEKGNNSFVIKLTVIEVSNTLSNIGVDN